MEHPTKKQNRRKIAPPVLAVIGIVIATYGITRWLVTSWLVNRLLDRMNDYHLRGSSDGDKIYKVTASIGGQYFWVSGAIGCCALGLIFLLIAYYLLINEKSK